MPPPVYQYPRNPVQSLLTSPNTRSRSMDSNTTRQKRKQRTALAGVYEGKGRKTSREGRDNPTHLNQGTHRRARDGLGWVLPKQTPSMAVLGWFWSRGWRVRAATRTRPWEMIVLHGSHQRRRGNNDGGWDGLFCVGGRLSAKDCLLQALVILAICCVSWLCFFLGRRRRRR